MKKAQKTAKNLFFAVTDSPLGAIILAEFEGKICMAEFRGVRAKRNLAGLKKRYGAELTGRKTHLLKEARKQLNLYFAGKLEEFNLPLDYPGTAFQRSVWRQLLRIPLGKTVNYGWIAGKTGSPGAARAAGAAIGKNRISIIIPCHRVVGKDGSLTGFGGGLWRKKWLLQHESGT